MLVEPLIKPEVLWLQTLATIMMAVKASGDGWAWGVVLQNLGSKISYTDNADAKDFIPANLGLGANYTQKVQ